MMMMMIIEPWLIRLCEEEGDLGLHVHIEYRPPYKVPWQRPSHLSIIPAISVCVSVCLSVCLSATAVSRLSVCLYATAVSRRPPVRSDWNLPGILQGPSDVPFRGLISIGRAVPKLRPFHCFFSFEKVYIWQLKVSFHLLTLSCHFSPKLLITRRPLVRSDWNLPGILPGPHRCAFSRFDINRTSGYQVTAIYLSTNDRTWCYDVTITFFFFARLTSQFFFMFVWYDVTIDTGDLSLCLFKVWYRSSSSISAVSQVFPKVWKLFFPKVW